MTENIPTPDAWTLERLNNMEAQVSAQALAIKELSDQIEAVSQALLLTISAVDAVVIHLGLDTEVPNPTTPETDDRGNGGYI
jgi:uncharacterized coiled-coil protein SlyX